MVDAKGALLATPHLAHDSGTASQIALLRGKFAAFAVSICPRHNRRLSGLPCTSRGVPQEFVCRNGQYCTDVSCAVSDKLNHGRNLRESHLAPAGMRPGDILTGMGGITVEINNTDAEVRIC